MPIMALMSQSALKILHVTRNIDPVGGCEIYIRNLINTSLAHNLKVSIATAISPTGNSALASSEKFTIPALSSFEHKSAQASVAQFKQITGQIRPDIIHIHDLNNPFILEFAGRHYPTVKTTLNADAYCGGIDKYLYTSRKECHYRLGFGCLAVAYYEGCMSRHPRRSLEIISIKKKALRATNSISQLIVPSNSSKQIMIQNRVPERLISVIPLFADLANEVITPYPKNTSPLILFIGRLRPYKGVSYLIQALKNISADYNAVIVGDGDERNALENLCRRLGVDSKIHVTGNVPHEKVSDYLNQCACLVVPSIYPDSFPTVGLEAMSRARPVIGFDIGGIPEWLDDKKTGFLVKTQNTEALAEKINYLLEHPSEAEAMGLEGRRQYELKFTKEVHFELISKVYQNAIQSFKKA